MSSSFRDYIENGVLILEFHSPRTGNSLGLEEARELSRLLKKNKSAKGLILRSAHPRLFCAGGRLSDYAALKKKSEGLRINREIARHLDGLALWPGLKLAVVNGDCYGGGMEWLASFDFRWGASDALFGFWQRRIGLTTGWGGGARWARFVPEDRLKSLLLSSDVFSAGEALRLGLMDRVVRREKIFADALDWMSAACDRNEVRPTSWTARTEGSVFNRLWWSELHRDSLRRWRK